MTRPPDHNGLYPASPPAGKTADWNQVTLRFNDPTLEHRFRESQHKNDLRKIRVLMILGALTSAGFAAVEWLGLTQNLHLVAIMRWLGGVGVCLLALFLARFPFFQQRLALLTAIPGLVFTLSYTAINAVSDSPDIYLSGYLIMILGFLSFSPLHLVASSFLAVASTLIFALLIPLTRDIEPFALVVIYSQFIAALALGIAGLYWRERLQRQNFLNFLDIADQRSRYGTLLTQILPTEIVERLDKGEADIADDFADTTVLFADIVGFTEAAARHSPNQVLSLLNRIFRAFDELVARHGVEKIKTIGDAYMVAGGLPQARPGHCMAIADLALDMTHSVEDFSWPDGTPVRLRIGLHTGPLVAGVIGNSRFSYDLWGDTVNMASRLESQSGEGRILVTETVHDRLCDRFDFEEHGDTDIKGKGTRKTWYLSRRKHAPAAPVV